MGTAAPPSSARESHRGAGGRNPVPDTATPSSDAMIMGLRNGWVRTAPTDGFRLEVRSRIVR